MNSEISQISCKGISLREAAEDLAGSICHMVLLTSSVIIGLASSISFLLVTAREVVDFYHIIVLLSTVVVAIFLCNFSGGEQGKILKMCVSDNCNLGGAIVMIFFCGMCLSWSCLAATLTMSFYFFP